MASTDLKGRKIFSRENVNKMAAKHNRVLGLKGELRLAARLIVFQNKKTFVTNGAKAMGAKHIRVLGYPDTKRLVVAFTNLRIKWMSQMRNVLPRAVKHSHTMHLRVTDQVVANLIV